MLNYQEFKNKIKEMETGKKFREWTAPNGKIINLKNKYFVNGNNIREPQTFNTFDNAIQLLYRVYQTEIKFNRERFYE